MALNSLHCAEVLLRNCSLTPRRRRRTDRQSDLTYLCLLFLTGRLLQTLMYLPLMNGSRNRVQLVRWYRYIGVGAPEVHVVFGDYVTLPSLIVHCSQTTETPLSSSHSNMLIEANALTTTLRRRP